MYLITFRTDSFLNDARLLGDLRISGSYDMLFLDFLDSVLSNLVFIYSRLLCGLFGHSQASCTVECILLVACKVVLSPHSFIEDSHMVARLDPGTIRIPSGCTVGEECAAPFCVVIIRHSTKTGFILIKV